MFRVRHLREERNYIKPPTLMNAIPPINKEVADKKEEEPVKKIEEPKEPSPVTKTPEERINTLMTMYSEEIKGYGSNNKKSKMKNFGDEARKAFNALPSDEIERCAETLRYLIEDK